MQRDAENRSIVWSSTHAQEILRIWPENSQELEEKRPRMNSQCKCVGRTRQGSLMWMWLTCFEARNVHLFWFLRLCCACCFIGNLRGQHFQADCHDLQNDILNQTFLNVFELVDFCFAFLYTLFCFVWWTSSGLNFKQRKSDVISCKCPLCKSLSPARA